MSDTEQKDAHPPKDAELELLRRFLYEQVEDLEELAVLAAMRAGSAVALEFDAVVSTTQLARHAVEDALARLVERGLVMPSALTPAAFAYAERASEFDALLDHAIAEYRRNPLQVMAFMTTNAIERVRGAARRTFGESLRSAQATKSSA